MLGEIVVGGLRFPEGPVWTRGALHFVEIEAGQVSKFDSRAPHAGAEAVAVTGGAPNAVIAGPDDLLFVTQSGTRGRPAAIQTIDRTGAVETLVTAVDGTALGAPNDLVFGPDGRLWFTDPNGPPDPDAPGEGRIFALDVSTGRGELIAEVGPVFPNGIAVDGSGDVWWTESFSRRLVRYDGRSSHGEVELPERCLPDGLKFGIDGRMYVAATLSHAVLVLETGEIVDRLICGDGMPTNCCFVGNDLYVTESRRGTIWRFADVA